MRRNKPNCVGEDGVTTRLTVPSHGYRVCWASETLRPSSSRQSSVQVSYRWTHTPSGLVLKTYPGSEANMRTMFVGQHVHPCQAWRLAPPAEASGFT